MTSSPSPVAAPLQPFTPASGPLSGLNLVRLEQGGPVFHLRLNRPAKRNSVSDDMLRQIHTVFVNLPGLGLQFAAVGEALYRKARAAGHGHELPTEWFTEDVVP